MSMATYEPDWDEGTEARYEVHRERHSSGLCERCHNDAVLPNDPDGWCASCVLEVETALGEVEGKA